MQKERQLQETLVTTKEPDTSRPIDIMPETAIPAIIAKNIMCTASAPDTTTGGVTNTAEASSITGDMSPMKELSFGADDSVELMHGWLRQKVNLGWRKRYVVLDQGLMR